MHMQAIKLYYHSLENILVSEERVHGHSNFSGLLTSTKFHKGLMACSLEVVVASYK